MNPIVTLLTPLPAPTPCGADLSFSPEFDAIQEMRRADDPTLEQGEWVTALKVADWPGVARACEELLGQRTKDLRVAGWLVDAWARLRGFGGLRDGLALCAGLVEQLWPQLHPLPDGDDFEQRIGNLSWLLGRVQELARQVPLGVNGPVGFSMIDVEAARSAARAEPGSQALPTLLRGVSHAGLAAFERQRAVIAGCVEDLSRLQAAVDAQLGDAGPSFSPARRALEAALDAWVRLGRDSGVSTEQGSAGNEPALGQADDAAVPGTSAATPLAAGGALSSRAQALQQLRQVADYFRRTEPHSPVAYLADKAARWGDMPLHAWLRTVVKDQGALAQLEDLLGTEPPPAN